MGHDKTSQKTQQEVFTSLLSDTDTSERTKTNIRNLHLYLNLAMHQYSWFFESFNNDRRIQTRPGVDKVKPKGWFRYSLQID